LLNSLKKIGFYEVSHFSTLLSGVFFLFCLANFQSLDDVGIFGIWITSSLILSQIGAFGFHNAIASFGVSNFNIDKFAIENFYRKGALYSLIFNFLIAILILAINSRINFIYGDQFLIILIIYIFTISQVKLLVSKNNTLGNPKIVAISNIVKSLSIILLTLLSFIINFHDYSYLKVFLLAEVINFLVMFIFTPKLSLKFQNKIREFSKFLYLKKCSRYAFNNLVFDSSTKVDLIMVSIFLPLNVVGIYTIIMNITEAFFGFSVHKRGEHYEWLLKQFKKSNVKKIKEFIVNNYLRFFLISIPILFSGYIYVYLLTQSINIEIIIALLLNIIGIFSISPLVLFYHVFFSIKMDLLMATIILISLICNIIVTYILIKPLGFVGASIGTCSSFMLMSFLLYKSIFRRLK